MDTTTTKTSIDLQLAQIAWVVKDIKAAEIFFKESMGINNFSKPEITRLGEFEGTYYGEPCNAENLVSMAYTGETFLELIQPVSGRSMFQDYIDKYPAGGIQHIAFSLPVSGLDKVIAELKEKGYPLVSTFNTPIAVIVFFDTTKDIGVFTEIIGIKEEGEEAVEKMKKGNN